MNVDGSQFWNGAISILAGIAAGAVAMLIIPPVSPAIRTQRLLSLTLMDFRRLVRRASPGRAGDWEQKGFARLLAMPDKAGAQERAELAAMVAVGKEIVRLRHIAPRFVSTGMVDAALAALAGGRSSEAIARLGDIDRQVAALPRARSRILLSLRASILAISGQLSRIRVLFRPTAPMRFHEINLFGLYVAPDRGDPRRRLGHLSSAEASRRPHRSDRAGLAPGAV